MGPDKISRRGLLGLGAVGLLTLTLKGDRRDFDVSEISETPDPRYWNDQTREVFKKYAGGDAFVDDPTLENALQDAVAIVLFAAAVAGALQGLYMHSTGRKFEKPHVKGIEHWEPVRLDGVDQNIQISLIGVEHTRRTLKNSWMELRKLIQGAKILILEGSSHGKKDNLPELISFLRGNPEFQSNNPNFDALKKVFPKYGFFRSFRQWQLSKANKY